MPKHVALLRGINVGRAKRVGMEDLRQVFADLGHSEVRTLLNSGNVIFTSPRRLAGNASERIEEAMRTRTGVASRVILLTEAEVRTILSDCPLLKIAKDPKRLLVAVPSPAASIRKLQKLAEDDWAPEVMAVGTRAAYLWSPEGVSTSSLFKVVDREMGDEVTTRNWSTWSKLIDAMNAS